MDELKLLTGREPRLLLSMDTRDKCPHPLADHGVFPLSISTKEFMLLRGDGWYDFPIVKTRKSYEARLPIELAASTIARGENAHIMRLETSGYLQEFLGSTTLRPAFSGKRMTPEFQVAVNGASITVKGAQYEVDQAYATIDDVILVECKKAHYSSCAIRQVYFPYRATRLDEKNHRSVRPIYVTFDEGTGEYRVRELYFQAPDVWESIRQEKSESVTLKLVEPPKNVIDLTSTTLGSNRIPQADSVDRIQEMPELVAKSMVKSSLIASYYGFHQRQSSYYRDAVESLGLLKLDRLTDEYELTADGRRYLEKSPQGRADELARRMSRLPAVRAVLSRLDDSGEAGMERADIAAALLAHAKTTGEQLNSTTANRRASTVRAYLEFIGSRTGALARTKDGRFYMREHVLSLEAFGGET